MGFLDFDGERFFDVREMDNYKLTDLAVESKDPVCLSSESRKRSDLSELFIGNIEIAQENKTKLEV
jgi:hypothetical protein